jgi:hypothetical protein
MKVFVRSSSHPPASLYRAARELQSCPGCVGTIELYRLSDGWRADVVHEPACPWILAEETAAPPPQTATGVLIHLPARPGAAPADGICPTG